MRKVRNTLSCAKTRGAYWIRRWLVLRDLHTVLGWEGVTEREMMYAMGEEIMKVCKLLSVRWVMFPPGHVLSLGVTPLALSPHTGGL